MKYQELKLQLKFHALLILYAYTSLNNTLALQFIIFLKSGLLFYHILLSRFTIDTYSVRWQWAIPFLNFVCKLCMLFRGFSSSNCPNLTGIMSYLIAPHTCRAFLKYALIAFLFYCQSAICEDKDKVMLMKKKLMPTRLLGKIITFLFPADLALCLTFYQASNNDMLFFFFAMRDN